MLRIPVNRETLKAISDDDIITVAETGKRGCGWNGSISPSQKWYCDTDRVKLSCEDCIMGIHNENELSRLVKKLKIRKIKNG